MRSPLCTHAHASSAAVRAACTDLKRTRVPKRMLAIRVDDQQNAVLAFFLEQFGVRTSGARGDAPVHLPDVVAGLIAARFDVVDAASAKTRAMRGRAMPAHARGRTHEASRAQTHRDQIVERDLRGAHRHAQGNGTRCSSASMTLSDVMPSASAS